jgi:hypothetical protein
MLPRIVRLIAAILASGVMFALLAFVLPITVMVVALYIAKLFPLTGQWRKRWRNRRKGFRSSG